MYFRGGRARSSGAKVWLVLAVGLASCGSPTAPEQEPLVGDWQWVQSSGGIAGLTLTPQSEGYEVLLRFTAAGQAEWWKDGVLTDQTGYETEATKTSSGADGWMVRYERPLWGFGQQEVSFPTSTTLILTDPCCDGFMFEFRRGTGP